MNRYNSFNRRNRYSRNGNGHRGNRFGRGVHASQYVNDAQPQTESAPYVSQYQFNDFQIDKQLLTNITARGYTTPTPIQDKAIQPILDGSDVVGIANTGTGKTAAFLIPLVNKIVSDRTQRVLIVTPTRELAVQINDECKAFSLSLNIFSTLCIGGTGFGNQIAALRRNPNVLVGTPGRLKDLISRHIINLSQFKTVVLDEVDRMVDIGFIADIRFIISRLPAMRQSLFFSATVTPDISGIIQSFTKSPITISVKVKETAKNIDQTVIRVKDKQERITKLNELLRQEEFKKVLIFGRTKWNVRRLEETLHSNGFSVGSIHGNKSQNQRLAVLSQFRSNRLKILVATDVASRGLDISGISHVINFDEPATYTDYVHRIGRTGRANASGKALTFVL